MALFDGHEAVYNNGACTEVLVKGFGSSFKLVFCWYVQVYFMIDTREYLGCGEPDILFLVIITGALHLDGLADCADAWVGGLGSKQRSLEIMKDPAAGPIAVVVLILLLLLKWSFISYILEQQALAVLVLTPVLGRLAILLLMLSTSYVRTAGLGEKLVENLPISATKAISLFSILISIYYLGIIPISFMLIMILIISYQAKKRLGGVTGDVYGAAVELVEVSILLGMMI